MNAPGGMKDLLLVLLMIFVSSGSQHDEQAAGTSSPPQVLEVDASKRSDEQPTADGETPSRLVVVLAADGVLTAPELGAVGPERVVEHALRAGLSTVRLEVAGDVPFETLAGALRVISAAGLATEVN